MPACPAMLDQSAARLDIALVQGNSVHFTLNFVNLDLTGCSHRLQVRDNESLDGKVIFTLTNAMNGGIIATPNTVLAGGSAVAISITPAQSLLIVDAYWYSHLITFPDGSERTYVAGQINPQLAVTSAT